MRTRAESDWEPEVATPSSEPTANGGVGQAVKEVTDRLKTSTPSCSKTSFHAGLCRSQTICAAVGMGATRSA